MTRYMGFLSATLVKRAYVYIVSVIYMAMIVLLMVIMSGSTKNDSTASITLYPNSFMAWFSFIFTTIFMSLTVIHVFKKQELEGTELLIAAKPISRPEIIFGKMFVILLAFVAFQFVTFASFYIGAQFDRNADGVQKFKYAFGIALGSILSGTLITSIILLLGTILGKTGLTVSTMLLAVAVFIFNMSVVPITGAIAPRIESSQVYVNKNGESVPIYDADAKYDYKKVKKNEDSKYKYLWLADIWGQWASLYEVVQGRPEKIGDIGNFYNTIHLKTDNFLDKYSDNIFSVKVKTTSFDGDKKIEKIENELPSFSSGGWKGTLRKIPSDVKTELDRAIADDMREAKYVININSFVNTITPYIDKMQQKVENLKSTKKFINDNKPKTGDTGSNVNQAEMLVKKYILEQADGSTHRFSKDGDKMIIYNKFEKVDTNNEFNIVDTSNDINIWSSDIRYIYQNNLKNDYYIESAKPFIKKSITIPVWTVIAVALVIIASIIYLRRDFK